MEKQTNEFVSVKENPFYPLNKKAGMLQSSLQCSNACIGPCVIDWSMVPHNEFKYSKDWYSQSKPDYRVAH